MELGVLSYGLGMLYYAIVAGLERAYFRVNRLEVTLRVSQKSRLAAIAQVLLGQPTRFFLAARFGKLLGLAAMAFGAWLLVQQTETVGPKPLRYVLVGTGLLALLILVGEILVRWGYQSYPNRLFKLTGATVLPLYWLVWPLRQYAAWVERRAEVPINPLSGEAHLLPYPPLATGRLRREDFLENELLENTELDTEVFSKALQLNIVRVREFMVPRTEIIARPATTTFAELVQAFIETGVSRIVIYGQSLDEIAGFVHTLDMLGGEKPLTQLLQPVLFVPESMSASALLGEIDRQHRPLAIVLDEFGGTAGLVTLEDVVEVVFGEIEDEFDAPDTEGLTEKQLSPGVFHFAGRLEVDYLNRKYQLNLPSSAFSTLAGLVLHLAERIPATGEVFRCGPFQLTVLQASKRKIELIKLEKRRTGA